MGKLSALVLSLFALGLVSLVLLVVVQHLWAAAGHAKSPRRRAFKKE